MSTTRHARHWIGGEFVTSGSQQDTISPATGEVIGSYEDGGGAEAQRAIDAAATAFKQSSWRWEPYLRATALSRLAEAYDARMGEVVETLCTENGKLRGEAGFEAHFIPRALRFASGLAMHNFGRVTDTRLGQQTISIRQAVGVAGVITPWNSPAYLSIRSIAPALAAGCAVVVKFPKQAAQSANLLSEIFASVDDIPAGIANVFVESGSEGAKLLVDSPKVPVVSYTGSTAVGRVIAEGAAKNLKRVSLELGGKTPHLVFADADLNVVVPTIVASSSVFGGQFCMTGSRILAHRDIAGELVDRLAASLKAVEPGPADKESSQIGPLIDKAAVDRVDQIVEEAIAAGAEAIVRGGPIREGELAKGAFYRPTLLRVPDTDRDIVQKETFGPVQTVQVFDTEEQAIDLANDTEYGLSACVWSRDVDTPMRVSRQLEAGLVSINSWANLAIESEEGGFKASGQGRLGGLASMEDFLEYKQITQDYIPMPH
jgi:betaine-aldehyde dehydrogenase